MYYASNILQHAHKLCRLALIRMHIHVYISVSTHTCIQAFRIGSLWESQGLGRSHPLDGVALPYATFDINNKANVWCAEDRRRGRRGAADRRGGSRPVAVAAAPPPLPHPAPRPTPSPSSLPLVPRLGTLVLTNKQFV